MQPHDLDGLEEAARSGGPASEEALKRLAEISESPQAPKDLRKAARRALYRLRSRGVKGAGQPPRPAPSGPGPLRWQLESGAASSIEGDGAVEALAVAEGPGGGVLLLQSRLDDRRGMLLLEAADASRREARELLEAAKAGGMAPLHGHEVARLLGGAVRLAREAGRGLPPSYFSHRERLDEALAPIQGGPYAWARDSWPEELSEGVSDAGRLSARVQASAVLANHPELMRWALPAEAVGPLADELRELAASRLHILPQTRQARLDRAVDLAARALRNGPMAQRMAARFAYTALRLIRQGDRTAAHLAAACSEWLTRPEADWVPAAVEALARRILGAYLAAPSSGVSPRSPGRGPAGLVLPPGASPPPARRGDPSGP